MPDRAFHLSARLSAISTGSSPFFYSQRGCRIFRPPPQTLLSFTPSLVRPARFNGSLDSLLTLAYSSKLYRDCPCPLSLRYEDWRS